jgi:hypothetical protein
MTIFQPTKVFESHTKYDAEYCDIFDRACARVGIDAFRSEYEDIKPPPYLTITNELRQSKALFLLMGKALIAQQERHDKQWEYTQNWIAYEIGVASALNIDIWVLCDDLWVNFSVPYFNNYIPYSIGRTDNFRYLVDILRSYAIGQKHDITDLERVTCPHEDCGISYNLHARVVKGGIVVCPCCLRPIKFPNGHLF